MFPIEHRAIHLYRYDAYEEYSWSVDVYGVYQPASFIYLCFESFRNLCQQYGLQLFKTDEIQGETFGLVTRLEDVKDVDVVKKALLQGKNVIALFPNKIIELYYQENKDRLARAIEAAQLLGISKADQRIKGSVSNREKIEWEEIKTNSKGRLFIASDAWLSDGYFMEGYGKTNENTDALIALTREFTTFKYEIVRIAFKNQVQFWPSQEPISFVIEITNHGPATDQMLIRLETRDEFEPLSPTERELSGLATLSKTSFAFQVVPRVDGLFYKPFKISIEACDGKSIIVYTPDWNLEIAPSLSSALRSHTMQDDASLSRLLSVFKNTNLFEDASVLPKLAKVDAKACLNRMRVVTEKLIYLVLDRHSIKLSYHNFANAIRLVQTNKILSARSVGYLHTIRVIGNLASHPNDSQLTESDVRIVSYALSCVMEEIINRGII